MAACVFLLALLLLPSPLYAADFVPRKGPILHFVQDKRIVRIQAPELGHPSLEWREKASPDTKKTEMKRDTDNFWQAELPASATEYRIFEDQTTTAWHITSPVPDGKAPFLFAAYGDNRSGGGMASVHRALLANMEKENPAFIIHTGDIVYRGDREDFWGEFFDEGRKTFASIPFQPSYGNHDLSRRNLYGRFFGLGDNGNTYYYFRVGRGHFIALDTTRDFSPGSPQYKFLKDKLEKIKGEVPIVVFFHIPAYSFSYHSSDPKVQAYLVPLFEKYGVTLVINGHDHNYQRIGPINGVTYVVTGGGGGPLYDVRDNPLHQYYKVVFHYVLFEVGEKSMTGTMKYRKEVSDDHFEISYEKKKAPPTPEEQRVIEKVKP